MPLHFLSPLHKATRQITEYLEPYTRELGVSIVEGHILTFLRGYAPVPVGELVRVFGIKQSTLTSLLDRLEKGGLIRRKLNPHDRRSFLIHITAAGRRLAARLNRRLEALEADIRARVKSPDMEGFRAVMRAVAQVTQIRLRQE